MKKIININRNYMVHAWESIAKMPIRIPNSVFGEIWAGFGFQIIHAVKVFLPFGYVQMGTIGDTLDTLLQDNVGILYRGITEISKFVCSEVQTGFRQ